MISEAKCGSIFTSENNHLTLCMDPDDPATPGTVITTSVPPATSSLQDRYFRLRSKVLEKRPILQKILETRGQESVFDYIKSYTTQKLMAKNTLRQQELIEAVREEIKPKLGDQVANETALQLQSYYYSSTIDHFGPIYHPWVLHFNLIKSAAFLEHPDPALKNIITFACANVSLNNFSFPRGMAFTSADNGPVKTHRLSFLPSNDHAYAIYGFRAYTQAEVSKIKNVLGDKIRSGEVTRTHANFLRDLFEEIYNTPEALSSKLYTDQITRTNFSLWKKLVPKSAKKEINFIYISQEDVVNRLLLKHHFNTPTSLHQLIFAPESEGLLKQFFNNLPEAFSIERKVGTYLFWANPKGQKHRLRLWRQGNILTTEDGAYSFELTPQKIAEGLMSGELIPSVLLTFLTLCFYYGLTCLGGLGQINYLPGLQEAYLKLQKTLGNEENLAVVQDVDCQHLGGELIASFLGAPDGTLVPATSLDLLLYQNPSTWSKILESSKAITLEESFDLTFPDDYPMHYMQENRDSELSSLTAKDISSVLGLQKRIPPCAFLG